MVPGMGVLYLFELLFLIGLRYAFIKSDNKSQYYWLVAWIFLAPVAAALAKGPGFAANRAAFMMPGIQILLALGGVHLLQNKNLRPVIGIVMAISFVFFINSYFVTQPALHAPDMVYGAKEVFEYLDAGVVTKKISEPHIYAAFYKKVDPDLYQQTAQSWNFEAKGLSWVDQLPEYTLGSFTFSENTNAVDTLIVTTPIDTPSIKSEMIRTVFYPNGKTAYVIRRNSL
jgi:hypothetical protein